MVVLPLRLVSGCLSKLAYCLLPIAYRLSVDVHRHPAGAKRRNVCRKCGPVLLRLISLEGDQLVCCFAGGHQRQQATVAQEVMSIGSMAIHHPYAVVENVRRGQSGIKPVADVEVTPIQYHFSLSRP